jgi:hypothetical protein
MPKSINLALTFEVEGGGPPISISHKINGLEAIYDTDKTINAGEEDVAVQISCASELSVLLITADRFSEEGAKLTYKVAGREDPVELDRAQLFVGRGALGLLNEEVPKELTFSNEKDEPVSLRIIAGAGAASGA